MRLFVKQKLLPAKLLVVASVVVIFVILGALYLLFVSHAATAHVALEPENGALTAGATVVSDAAASGGKGVAYGLTTSPTPTPTAGPLPYALPTQNVLKASPKKVFAHYFTPYPLQITNEPAASDYYARVYTDPDDPTILTKSATLSFPYYAMGGFLRERPLPQPVGATSWELDNMKTEVRRATAAGLDGFTVDVLSLSGYNWDRLKLLLQAATSVDPKFKIVLMPDENGGAVKAGPAALATAMAGLASDPAVYKLANGNLVISPFKAEGTVTLDAGGTMTGIAYWTQFMSLMKGKAITVAFVPCFLSYSASNATAFASISYGYSNWGNRYPAGNTGIAGLISDAHARGKIWMQPVSLQDSRPNQNAYWESNNTENFRTTWNGASGGADWVQIPTWNDYSENAQIAPSTHIGWSPLDINGYYLTKYKTGTFPAITKDVIYVSHRIQPFAALPTSTKQTRLQVNKVSGTPSRDKVEVLSFMIAAGTLSVTIGGVTQTVAVPAGVSSNLFDLKPGVISAKVVRGTATVAAVTSPFPVLARPYAQDLEYHFVSSARSGGIGAYNDPQY